MIEGILAFVTGLRTLFVRAELRFVLWRMIGLLFVLMLALAGSVYWLADYVAGMWIPEGDSWYWQLLGWLAWLLAVVLALISGAVAFVTLGSAVAAPWLDMLAARVEATSGQPTQESQVSWLQQSLHSLGNSVHPLLELLLWGVAAVLCFWLPPLATVIWIYGSICFLSFELIDTMASRRNWNFARRRQLIRERRWFFLGFSGLAIVLITMPLLNLFVIPAAVVGLGLRINEDKEQS